MHSLLALAATKVAKEQWREKGARSEAEMRAILIGSYRRRMGTAAVQAFARHRIHRVPYIGMPRAVVEARQRGQQGDGGGWVHAGQEIYADLARVQAGNGWAGEGE